MKKILIAFFFAILAGCGGGGGGSSNNAVVGDQASTSTEQRPGDVAANTPRFGDVSFTGSPTVAVPDVPPVVDVPVAAPTPVIQPVPEVMMPPITVISNPSTPEAPPVVLVPVPTPTVPSTPPTPPMDLSNTGGHHCGWQPEDHPNGWNYVGNNYYYKVDPAESSGYLWKYVRPCDKK